MEASPLDLFRQNDLFRGLEPWGWEVVRPYLRMEQFPPDTVIFNEGETGDSLYLIGSGVVRISKMGRGGQQETLSLLEAGDYFGDLAAFNIAPRSARATAVNQVTAATLERSGLEVLMKAAPLAVVENLSRGLIQRLRATDEHLVAELLAAERLSLVGAMAGSIVHDLINLLNPAQGYIQLLRRRGPDPAATRWIDGIERSMRQALDMLQELLEFHRGSTPALRLERVELGELIEQIDEQYLCSLAPLVEVRRDLEYAGPIVVDTLRLSRVIINLCKNAAEAMRDGGVLRLATSYDGEWVTIAISDTGCGIPPEILPRIFDAFVTHGKQNGTGLGMAIARSVIEAHGGTISVESAVGEGTTVRVRLPLAMA